MLVLFNKIQKSKDRNKAKAMKRITNQIEAMKYIKKLDRDIDIALAEPVEVLNVWDAKNSKWLK